MSYEGSWISHGRDFTPQGAEKTAAVCDQDPAPLTLEGILRSRLDRDGRLGVFEEKMAGFKIDGEVTPDEARAFAGVLDKIAAAVGRRERRDELIVNVLVEMQKQGASVEEAFRVVAAEI